MENRNPNNPRYNEEIPSFPADSVPRGDVKPKDLERLGGAGLRLQIEALLNSRCSVPAEALLRLGDPAVAVLLSIIEETTPNDRRTLSLRDAALRVIGLYKNRTATRPLTEIVVNPNEPRETRAYALSALAQSNNAESVRQTIAPFLQSQDVLLRQHAVNAFVIIGKTEDTPVLEQIVLADPVEDIKITAYRALEAIGMRSNRPVTSVRNPEETRLEQRRGELRFIPR